MVGPHPASVNALRKSSRHSSRRAKQPGMSLKSPATITFSIPMESIWLRNSRACLARSLNACDNLPNSWCLTRLILRRPSTSPSVRSRNNSLSSSFSPIDCRCTLMTSVGLPSMSATAAENHAYGLSGCFYVDRGERVAGINVFTHEQMSVRIHGVH